MAIPNRPYLNAAPRSCKLAKAIVVVVDGRLPQGGGLTWDGQVEEGFLCLDSLVKKMAKPLMT